jgi:hypothetical protein
MTERKTVKDLENELMVKDVVETQRQISNLKYARKELERAVIWFFALLVSTVTIIIVNGWFKK